MRNSRGLAIDAVVPGDSVGGVPRPGVAALQAATEPGRGILGELLLSSSREMSDARWPTLHVHM
eukprot:9734688-Alexandrium_andersonii.AAC.1